ncbi:hypothetical protein [Nitrosomonas communis]|uniref:Uncharacterized protein n=1 Tax=Nitrosomonas communis TaxID=44574 RepID=A0A1I4UBW1_9PROT|nr:hypothetical protein [Nitrosomonas communis]SFM86405.1 hypothetical protein SAMN05421863_106224 [Nitrosomonas communis]
MRDVSLVNVQGLPELDFRIMPDRPITFEPTVNIAGLELVDIYLWVVKKFMEGRELASELLPIIKSLFHRGQTDEISVSVIASRWKRLLDDLPETTEENRRRRESSWQLAKRDGFVQLKVMSNYYRIEATAHNAAPDARR